MQICTIRNEVKIPIGKHMGEFVTFHGLVDRKEHLAINFKVQPGKTPLVRMHSECLTGDVFQSHRCDCGEQLNEAIDLIAHHGGTLLYLRQEGRGIGLYNKIDAYQYQLEGFDTYAANKKLGLENDLRDYTVAAQMLRAMGMNRVKLLTNNPDKIQQLVDLGIAIEEQLSTSVFLKEGNVNYLKAKVDVTSHRLKLDLTQEALKCCL
ncbi:GTP cyclohydrolase II [Bacteriovoracaceae bacterium]|nr:GTP cyclohydrolase II [Bacteriovoracaceae bacterium]